MFLYDETAQSPSATCGKDGSVEHLFALIDLCKLIEQHKKFSVGLAESFENDDLGVPESSTEKLDTRFACPIGRHWEEPDRIGQQRQRTIAR